ncbi:MAG TPA: phosphatidate cytidylyltransferase [Methylibium sp.]|nr:phosphatidate cytidylyltransferase [Methylibium sp.]
MLKQRVITAVLLLAVLLPVLWLRPLWPFALLTLVMVGAAGWEWARLNGMPGGGAWGLGMAVAFTGLAAWSAGWTQAVAPALWWAAMAAWVLGGAAVLGRGVAGWPRLPGAARLLLGAGLLWLAWLAMVQAKAIGLNFLLSVFVLVWAADIAAYFGGRAFGRRKLAPAISPGKSWEGVWSGMAGVLLLATAWIVFDQRTMQAVPSLYSLLLGRLGAVGLVVAALFLAALSVVGDLFESLVKRSAGAKDSSGLLPGHGGVLDRIDALLPVFPAALALASL